MVAEIGTYFDVTDCEVVGPYTLCLRFNDGTQRTINFEPVLYGPVFEPLRDIDSFNQVTVNHVTGTIEWPTGADYNPTILHDWPDHVARIIADLQRRYAVAPAST